MSRRLVWGGVLRRVATSSSAGSFTIDILDERWTLRLLGDYIAKISDGTLFVACDACVEDIEYAVRLMDPARYPHHRRPAGPLYVPDTRSEPRSARYARLARECREAGTPDPELEELAALAAAELEVTA